MHSNDLVVFFLGLSMLLGSAHLFGEAARRLGQPIVVGEMLAGLLLGPTFLGHVAPTFQRWLFPETGPSAIALHGLVSLAVALLLLVAGLEVDLSSAWRHGRSAMAVAAAGLLAPLILGGGLCYVAPSWWGMPESGNPELFAVFFGAALAVSALPVIAKIFLDLDLLRSDFGIVVLVAATLNNLAAWLLFSVVLGGEQSGSPISYVVLHTVAYVAFMLSVARYAANRALPWVQAHLSWPSGVLGFILVVGLAGAAITEAIGIHAIFGAFLAGIALGDSAHLREHTREIVRRFVEGILAPIFVAAIGLKVNFVAELDVLLVTRVVLVGVVTKVFFCAFAARRVGLDRAEAWAVGWAMNARGEIGIILSLLAWEAGIIREELFVALVALALITSAIVGPMLKRLLRRARQWTLASSLDRKLCVLNLDAADAETAIKRLAAVGAERAGLEPDLVAAAVLGREELMGTGLGDGVAVPHARPPGIKAPLVVAGVARYGLDFDAPDGEPVRLIFLVLTPPDDGVAQVELLASITRLTRDRRTREEALAATSPTAFLAALRVADVMRTVTDPVAP